MKVKMHYKKFLVSSLLLLGFYQVVLADNDPFNQGINFANGNKPGTNMISNSVIESAVGKTNVNQAVANQDSIQNSMGGSYKNIDGVTNAGNSKASACVGKKTDDCKAYNFYNDPLTKQSQQGVESAVSIASNLINKKINQGVSITDYCASHPNDSVCVMCAKNPSLSTCQSGNKCTTITYNTNNSTQTSNSCQIIGHRSYDCKQWVDDIAFHFNNVPPSPTDGTVFATGYAQDTSRVFCSITVQVIAYEYLTKQNTIYLTATSRSDDGGWNEVHSFSIAMNNGGYQFVRKNDNNGHTNKTMIGNVNSGSCNGNSCSISVSTSCIHGQLGGNDWNVTANATINYTKPSLSRIERVIDKVSIKDNCNQ